MSDILLGCLFQRLPFILCSRKGQKTHDIFFSDRIFLPFFFIFLAFTFQHHTAISKSRFHSISSFLNKPFGDSGKTHYHFSGCYHNYSSPLGRSKLLIFLPPFRGRLRQAWKRIFLSNVTPSLRWSSTHLSLMELKEKFRSHFWTNLIKKKHKTPLFL